MYSQHLLINVRNLTLKAAAASKHEPLTFEYEAEAQITRQPSAFILAHLKHGVLIYVVEPIKIFEYLDELTDHAVSKFPVKTKFK